MKLWAGFLGPFRPPNLGGFGGFILIPRLQPGLDSSGPSGHSTSERSGDENLWASGGMTLTQRTEPSPPVTLTAAGRQVDEFLPVAQARLAGSGRLDPRFLDRPQVGGIWATISLPWPRSSPRLPSIAAQYLDPEKNRGGRVSFPRQAHSLILVVRRSSEPRTRSAHRRAGYHESIIHQR